MAINFAASVLSGWPKKRMFDAPTSVLILRGMIHLSTFMLLIGVSCFFYVKIVRQRRKIGESQIAAAISLLRKDDLQLNNLDKDAAPEFGGVWFGEDSNSKKSVEENHWKSNRCIKSKKKPKNKVDIFIIEVSLKSTISCCYLLLTNI